MKKNMNNLSSIEKHRQYQKEYERKKKKNNPKKYLVEVQARVKKWREKNPLKVKAYRKIFVEVRAGRMKKQPCIACDNKNTEAHHEDYSRPLDVVWLCKKHHRLADRKEL